MSRETNGGYNESHKRRFVEMLDRREKVRKLARQGVSRQGIRERTGYELERINIFLYDDERFFAHIENERLRERDRRSGGRRSRR